MTIMDRDKEIQLTAEQQGVIDAICAWIGKARRGDGAVLTLGGLAGVGKTTVLKYLLEVPPALGLRVAVATFTGKAAAVLKRKGVARAQTIHSLIYKPQTDVRGKLVFVKLDDLPYDLIVIDEASTVNRILDEDLRSFGIPILYVGDMGQLEPIGDNPNLMANPQLTLTTIHRQALKSPIIGFAHQLRQGKLVLSTPVPPSGMTAEEMQEFRESLEFGDYRKFVNALGDVDQVICGFNRTRNAVNRAFRQSAGYTRVLEPGDRVICLQNNRKLGIYNGLMGDVVRVSDRVGDVLFATVRDDLGRTLTDLCMDSRQFGVDAIPYEDRKDYVTYWDYSYCVSCHKAIGSEFESVAVYEQLAPGWSAHRWGYTAATRAAKKLIYCR